MKNEMKQTEIGEIPVEWEVVKAGEVFINVSDKNHPEEELLSVTQDNGVVLRSEQERRVVMPDGTTAGYKLVKQGDFIISLRSFQGGLEYSDYQGLVSPAYTVLRKTAEIHDAFLKFLFKTQSFIDRLSSSVVGIRDGKQINFRDFKHVYIQLPPLPEQRKIAEILSTLDEKMAVMDEQLAQTQELKKGLMQRLLTKGIGHTQFKDSPLGEIPASWDVRVLEEVCDEVFLGLTSKVHYVESGGFPLIRTSDISNGKLSFENAKFISEEQHKKLTKKRLTKRGDVLVSKSGSLGTCVLVDTDAEFSTYESIITIQTKKNILHTPLLFHLLKDSDTQKRMLGAKVGGIVGHLNLIAFRRLIISLPPLPEQRQIAEILTTVDEKIGVLQDKKAQYQTLKRGLMQQLLTGQRRVRVPALETAALV